MAPHVGPQHLACGEVLAAVIAAVRALARVQQLVLGQGEVLGEAEATLRALEGLCPRVHGLVRAQVGLLGEALATPGAGEGALDHVGVAVGCQVVHTPEALPAGLAGIRPLTCVQTPMRRQVLPVCKALPALPALQLALAGPRARAGRAAGGWARPVNLGQGCFSFQRRGQGPSSLRISLGANPMPLPSRSPPGPFP